MGHAIFSQEDEIIKPEDIKKLFIKIKTDEKSQIISENNDVIENIIE